MQNVTLVLIIDELYVNDSIVTFCLQKQYISSCTESSFIVRRRRVKLLWISFESLGKIDFLAITFPN